MVTIGSLWLAIVLSAVLVFVASALVWMVLPHHKADFKKLPDEDGAIAALRPQNLAPGQYNIPHAASQAELANPDVKAKFEAGPVAFMTVLPNGVPAMGGRLVQSFIYYLVVSALAAYMVTRTVAPDADYLAVFRVVGTVTWVAYSWGVVQDAIWFGRPWSFVWKQMGDGFLYALLTAGVFGWQWPG